MATAPSLPQCDKGRPSVEISSVGFIGAGNIAQAVGFGLIRAGCVQPSAVYASAPSKRFMDVWVTAGCNFTHDNKRILRSAEVVMMACKPHLCGKVLRELEELRSSDRKAKLFISLAAGYPLSMITSIIKSIPVARVMTNTAAKICKATTAFSLSESEEVIYHNCVQDMFSELGVCVEVDEKQMDVVCAMAGSGIAFMFSFLEAMSDGGVKMGLSREMSIDFAIGAMSSAAALAEEDRLLDKKHEPGYKGLARLRENVCSPGGTTIHGLYELDKKSVKSSIMDAISAATRRSRELGALSLSHQD